MRREPLLPLADRCEELRCAAVQVEGLIAILDLRSAVVGSEAAAKAEDVARPAALRALCLLCQSGAHSARRLLAAGDCASGSASEEDSVSWAHKKVYCVFLQSDGVTTSCWRSLAKNLR